MIRHFLHLAAALAVVIAAAVPRPLAAQTVDVIRGRVAGPDRAPIADVGVTVTSVSGNVNRQTRTDAGGRFTITFPGGDGDYFVTFQAIGYAPRRFEVKRVADEDFLVADATMQPVARLDAVEVTAQRNPVSRRDANAPDVGGTDRAVNPAAVPPDQIGDLAAMAAAMPGVTPVPGADGDLAGFSVLGLSPDQNNTALNGMNTGLSNLPRDAATSVSLGSPYDVSRGGFSGAQLSVRTTPGTNLQRRTLSMLRDAPQLQWTDRAARALGQQYTNGSLGGLVSGPIRYDKVFYNVSYQLGRRSSDLRTLLDAGPAGLRAAGVAADSVTRLLSLLNQASVPTTAGSMPGSRLSDQGIVFGSIDFTPPTSTSGQSLGLTFNGNWTAQRAASLQSVTELPSHSGDRTSWQGGAAARHSGYLKNVVLTETQLALNAGRTYATPYLSLPNGTVRVSSTFDDGTNSVQPVSFGGSSTMNTSQRTLTLGLMNQMSWFSLNNKHRLKLTSELRRESYDQDLTTNRLGTFAYNSLADLQANRPAVFTRQLAPRTRTGEQLVAALSLGDSYRPKPGLQLQYGVRLDGNRFGAAPATNADVARLFGTPNDAVPNRLYLSPRAGFSWTYGSAPTVAGFEGAARVPRAVVRGGAGVFQNGTSPQLLGAALDNTGLPGGVQQITCVGAAAPVPDWRLYGADPSAIPTTCADGSAGSAFGNDAPAVSLLARSYRTPRSVRSNLQWSGPVLTNRFALTVDGTYSLNLYQPSAVDLNFAAIRRFTLAEEGNRPVFVQPASIVPATGAIAPGDARVSPLFSRVSEQRSDMRSESRQLSVSLAPATFSTRFAWNLAYTFQRNRERTRGFTGTTAGSPLDVEWSRSSFNPTHQVNYGLRYNVFNTVTVNWSGVLRSGMPFTPQVFGDVNGDGVGSNDRAFVFDPARASDPALAAGMQALLDGGSPTARDCLRAQLGRVAARNSCVGPWTHTANMSLTLNPLKLRLPQRVALSFSVYNPLGAADQLLHGERGLRGWGQSLALDPALLYVRGFDPATGRYRYEVNQRFASTRLALAARRQPVTVQARLAFDIGPTREEQSLVQTLDRGRRRGGDKLPEFMLKAMYGTGGIPNPLAQILREADSLRLTGAQADSIATMNRRYIVRLDSIWAPLAKHFAELPADYDQDEAYERYRAARRASVDQLAALAPHVRALLTAEQRRKLPATVAPYLDTRYLASIRSGTANPGGVPILGGGGGPGDGREVREVRPGGTIIRTP